MPAPPARVFEAVRQVTAGEISLFELLTWIRRGGRALPEGVLNAPADEPILDVAIRGGFVLLAEDVPRELVLGAVVVRPPGSRDPATPDLFRKWLPPGFVLATMNFRVAPGGAGSVVSTETRVMATDSASRRKFGTYWRIIYPGSALIRRMWLRAIRRRATGFSRAFAG